MRKLLLLNLIFFCSRFFSQNHGVDSLLGLLKNAKPDTSKVNILFSLTEVCEEQDILKYAEPGLKLAEELKYQKGIANILANIANILANIAFVDQQQGRATRALELYQRSLKIHTNLNNYVGMSGAYRQIGDIYHTMGNSATALDYYQKGLTAAEKGKDLQSEGRILSQIALIYTAFKNYKLALEYYQKGLAINIQMNDKDGLSVTYNDMGTLYHKQHNLTKALYLYNKSLAIQTESGNKLGLARCLNNIAAVYESSDGDMDKALQNYLKCVEILQQVGFKRGLAATYINLAVIYEKKKDLKTAEAYGLKSFEIGKQSENLRDLNQASETLYSIYATQKKYKEAFEMHKIFKNTSDKISSTESQRASLQFDFNRKVEASKAEQLKRDVVTEKEKQTQRMISVFVSAVLIIVLIFSLLLFKRFKLTQKQKQIIEHQKKLVDEKQKEISDSINYAGRIQRSFLASEELLSKNFKEHFVFFQPKDVVSGDFYWAHELNNKKFALVTADSTGHGVPGAIMSILNISCLEKSVEEKSLVEPADILNHTRAKIIERLKKDGSKDGGKDGMDCSLVVFDFINDRLTYSAANNPVWVIRNKELIVLAADKMPVGKHDRDTVPFSQHTFELIEGDVIYTFTDGMPDQFGGPNQKKFMYKPLKNLLISISQLSMNEQREKLHNELMNWKGELEQVDDVCIVGVRV